MIMIKIKSNFDYSSIGAKQVKCLTFGLIFSSAVGSISETWNTLSNLRPINLSARLRPVINLILEELVRFFKTLEVLS